MSVVQAVADRLEIPRKPGLDLANEQQDLGCGERLERILSDERELSKVLKSVQGGVSGQLEPERLRKIGGMGTVFDYRQITLKGGHVNGGKITPLVFVEHIPVIRQMSGRADLDVLWRVLVAQGLMVHNGDDAEGNVALYAPLDRLCFHARGVNSFSCGTEHMHLTTLEDWTEKQLNAAAYLSHRAHQHHDLPRRHGRLGDGQGFATVLKRGHVTHEAVSNHAQFFDRSDPGDKYEALMTDIMERALSFAKHHRFASSP